ncbi:hypothetical protein M9H77_22522 [Catharanthus roseus]|uniref:Uncharacterized protein n=1 Tax=Catharanthus roseus TaxID=4058 RepID=A0ACC0ARM8_CATRO|nr:hypothetical protein M9H77_22522 [Catharanthus roseus]
MQGRNKVEEVLCLSAQRGYMVFYRNCQIADIKASLEFSRTKENFNAKSNPILRMVSNKINEISRATEIIDDSKNKCGHCMRISHGLPCSCELITRFDHTFPIQLVDIEAFWKTLEIRSCHPSAPQHDMDFEMYSLTDLLHKISTGPISKVREMRRLAEGVLNPVLPKDPGITLTSPPEEHVSIAYQKIQKSSRSGYCSGFGSKSRLGSGSGSGSSGKERPARAPRGRGRGRSRGRSSLSSIVDPSLYYVFGDENQWAEIRRRMLYKLEHSMNMYLSLLGSIERVYELVYRTQWQNGPAPLEHWLETPDSLYVIANEFNLCVILIAQLGSTTVLPLYSYSDCPGGTLVIGLLSEQHHFIQLQMHDGCPIPPLHVQ